jgi:HlyD family secretion protein
MTLTKKKKIWIGAAAVAVLGAIIFFSIKATRKDEVLVQTAKAQRKDVLKSKVAASGEIRAKEFVDLQSEVTGVITEVTVREGDTVKKGDMLLKIDPLQTEAETSSA